MKDRIDTLLVEKGYFESRQKAKYAIANKCVYVNGICIEKSSKEYDEDCKIEVKGESMPFVSRGGLKLDKAIKNFKIDLKDKVCMDIGASTGGFTDCMLQNGAKLVYAVDVGHGQLVEKLKNNERVVSLEGTNVRDLDINTFPKLDFISIDVSFISLTNVLDKAYSMLNKNGEIVALIKPQFEAGKENLSKNGIVKDKKVHVKVIEKIVAYSTNLGLNVERIEYSPIKGTAGNIEYLMYLNIKEMKVNDFNIKNLVEKAHKELKEVSK